MISFTPNDEQQLIIETVRRYATERMRPAAHDADESGATPAAIIETGWELGLLPSALPEQYGGFGETHSALTGALAAEELGYGDLAIGMYLLTPNLFGIPIQIAATLATKVLPISVNDAIFPFVLDLALGYPARYGLKRPKEGILRQIARSSKIPVLDVGTVRKVAEGAIKIAPGVSAVTENGVLFEGGRAGDFDAIIFATGYRPNYRDFLDAGGSSDGLHFVGFKNPVTGLLREIAHEARRVTDLIAAR